MKIEVKVIATRATLITILNGESNSDLHNNDTSISLAKLLRGVKEGFTLLLTNEFM